MGTEVLRPQDCLIKRIRVAPAVIQHPRRRDLYGNGSQKPNARVGSRKPEVRPEQKKRIENLDRPLASRRSASLDNLRKSRGHQMVVGQVTILKRGELPDVKAPVKASDDMVVYGTDRLGPDPGMLQQQIRIVDLKSVAVSPVASGRRSDMYAGSAFSMSPSPRALPLPSFFSKDLVPKFVDDSATRDLRRLLRLD